MTVHHGAELLYSLAAANTGPVGSTPLVPNQAQKTAMLNGLTGYTLYQPLQILSATVTISGTVAGTYIAYGVVPPSGPAFQYAILDSASSAILLWPPLS